MVQLCNSVNRDEGGCGRGHRWVQFPFSPWVAPVEGKNKCGESETSPTQVKRNSHQHAQRRGRGKKNSNATYRAGEACVHRRRSQPASGCRGRPATWESHCWVAADPRRCGWALGDLPLMMTPARSTWHAGIEPRQTAPAGFAAPRWPSKDVFYESVLVSWNCSVDGSSKIQQIQHPWHPRHPWHPWLPRVADGHDQQPPGRAG